MEQNAEIARLTARMLWEVGAVHFRPEEPYIFTSGLASPVYIDCRKLIAFPRIRRALTDFTVAKLSAEAGYEQFDVVAGGETAGIPYAAFLAERMTLPMAYVRKKPKGFGRNARIEGDVQEGDRALLVEDLATDGGSKLNFASALREAGATCAHVSVVFYYDIFKHGLETLEANGLTLHYLATWWDVLAEARASARFDEPALAAVEAFLNEPLPWSGAHGGTTEVVAGS